MIPEPFASLVPRLRRYAHNLTGSIARGDALVQACLDVAAADPERFGIDPHPRILSLLNEFWAAAEAVAGEGGEADPGQTVRHGIAMLPAAERQVLLLTLLEGFSLAETARSLGLSRDEAVELFDRGRAGIARQDGLGPAGKASASLPVGESESQAAPYRPAGHGTGWPFASTAAPMEMAGLLTPDTTNYPAAFGWPAGPAAGVPSHSGRTIGPDAASRRDLVP
ncbi:sigma factor-like helix-turn-helix DNA-binding protein [Inquilinus limosus]|uniref:sigma factor-like helix-turn-helix DNA-binding protein n=1 Tax=Inquilinus limosus TaxID=171674 RepID=UPI0012DF38BA|nr:sigma factor-like helix-turn-helix DNA-binding protein [Inquilinus limosus]